MSVPNNLFIDTSIFDEQNYNFESAAFRPFMAAIAGKALKFILPDPTYREIKKHIAERADAVVKALEDARRQAPFLARSQKWPAPGFALSWELRQLAMEEWKGFLKHFNVQNLSFEGVNLGEIMNWYDNQHAPFGPRKRKEFPDALALGSLLAFARAQNLTVAVISSDPDFKSACDRFAEVLYFRSLPAFTEALIASDRRVERVKVIFKEDSSLLDNAVKEGFPELHFYPAGDPDGSVAGVRVSEVEFMGIHVVGVGENECMIAFDASVRYSAHVEYDDPDSAIVDSSEGIYHKHRTFSGIVSDEATLSGTAKISVVNDWSAFKGISYFDFSEPEIEVTEIPPEKFY